MTIIPDERDGSFNESDHALLAMTFDPSIPNVGTLAAAGVLNMARIRLRSSASVTNVHLVVPAAAVGATAGQNFAALYRASDRALIAVTADQTTAWGSGGTKSAALVGGPYVCARGYYYVAWWANAATTLPQFGGGSSFSVMNLGMSSPNMRYCTADTGLTTTGPATYGTQTAAGRAWWAAIS